MRKGWIVWGIVVAVVGLLITIGGGIALLISQTASSLDPVAEAHTPGTASFVAEAVTYKVLLVTGRRGPAASSATMVCQVTLADGTTITLDGSVQAVSTEAANTESIGSFDAVAGDTSVTCESSNDGVRFVVDEEGALDRVGTWVLLGGVIVLLAGVGLILGGVFMKKPAR